MKMIKKFQLISRRVLRPVVRFFIFYYYNTHFVDGDAGKVKIGKRVGLANTLCNVSSGNILIGDYCAFGYNVMLLTGRHRFVNGQRASLNRQMSNTFWGGSNDEVPETGFDIVIHEGCWIASGVIISGGVTIGKNSIVAAGAVVTSSLPEYSIAAGIPAQIIGDTRHLY